MDCLQRIAEVVVLVDSIYRLVELLLVLLVLLIEQLVDAVGSYYITC